MSGVIETPVTYTITTVESDGVKIVAQGVSGPQGPSGIGLPAGGTDGQAPLRDSNAANGITWTTLTKNTVGLGNADNTSDGDKPVSTATQAVLNAKAPLASPAFTGTPTAPTAAGGTNTSQIATTAFIQAAITSLVNAAPGALDTLKELADALGDDPNFAATLTAALAGKAGLASPAFTGNPTAPTRSSGDNSTSLATTAFVQQAGAAGVGTTIFRVAPYGAPIGVYAHYFCANNTNNEVEINQAIVAANALADGGIAELLGGRFFLGGSIVPLNYVWLRGNGMFRTKVQAAAPNSAFPLMGNTSVYSIPSNPWKNATISDMELDGSNLAPIGYKGLDGHGMQDVRLTRLYVHDTTASGLGFDYPYRCVVDNNLVIRCGFVNKHTITAASWAGSTFTFTTADAHGYTAGIQATGLLTATGSISDGDTVTLASATYTFKTTLTGAAYEVLINGSVANALTNLQKAVNSNGTAGTDYGTGTLINILITAGTATATTLPFTAKNFGTGGNALATTETSAGLSFGGTTLSGGANASHIILAAMLPSTFNGIYNVTSVISPTQFTIGPSNNAGTLTLAFDPGTATQFGTSSDYNIGHNGIGIASGGLPEESLICTNNVGYGNQNNNFLIEADAAFTGIDAGYLFANNVSLYGGSGGFRNTASRNTEFSNNYDYGSLTGFWISSFPKAANITAASWSGGVATFTASAAFSFVVGQHIAITGMTPTGYNGYFTVASVPTTTTFTVVLATDPGTATFDPNSSQAKATYVNNPTEGTILSENISSNNMLYALDIDSYCDGYSLRGNIFKNATHYGMYIQSGYGSILGGKSFGHGRDGLRITPASSSWPANAIDISHLHAFNNGKLTAGYGIILNATTGTAMTNVNIADCMTFDDQVAPTQVYGIFVNTPGTYNNIQIHNNTGYGNVTRNIQISPTTDGIYVTNNPGTNPLGRVTLGSVTNTVIFDCTKGNYFTATLAGNITASFNTTGVIIGTEMILELTQDATGSRLLTLPSSATAAQGSLKLSTAANAIDIVRFIWDGSKWRESGRDLTAPTAVANGGTGASTLTGLVKGNGTGAFTPAVAGTDYLAPTGNGSALTGLTESQISGLVSDLAAKAPVVSPALTGSPTAPTAPANTNNTQLATTAYADAAVAAVLSANDAMLFKGIIDASASPNYPAADAGHTYRISAAGKIGGAAGINVEIGDMVICLTDGTAAGNQATVGTNWSIVQTNIDGAVVGPSSATPDNIATFSGTSGKMIQDSGKPLPAGALAGTSDTQVLTNKDLSSPTNTFPQGSSLLDTVRKQPVLFNDFLVASAAASMDPFTATLIASGTINTPSLNSTAAHPGVTRLRSSTTANSGVFIGTNPAQILLGGGEVSEFVCRLETLALSTFRMGFLDTTTSADATDGAYVEIDSSGVATGKSSSNSTRTTTGTTYTMSAATWYRVKVTVNSNATVVTFAIYNDSGTLLWSDTVTTNIPTASGRDTGMGLICTNSGTTIVDLTNLDYMALSFGSARAR